MSILGTFLVVVPLFQHTGHVTAALKRALNFNDISVLTAWNPVELEAPVARLVKIILRSRTAYEVTGEVGHR